MRTVKTRPYDKNQTSYLSQGTPTQVEGSVPLTSMSGSAAFDIANNIYFSKKQATLMRRSTILSLILQLVFPAWSNNLKLILMTWQGDQIGAFGLLLKVQCAILKRQSTPKKWQQFGLLFSLAKF